MMPDDLIPRLRDASSAHTGSLLSGLLAEAADELERLWNKVDELHTWRGLLSILDECYPISIFPGPGVDPGPRIIALLRQISELRTLS